MPSFLMRLAMLAICWQLFTFAAVPVPNNPKQVALAFIRHLLALEFQQAAALGTDNTRALLNIAETMLKESSKELFKTAVAKEIDPKKLKITCTSTGAESADCAICCNQYGEAAPESLHLVRVNKRWLVDMKKE